MMKLILIIMFCLAVQSNLAQNTEPSKPRIQLNAILNNAVVITINGKQQMLKKDAKTREGFQLVDISTDSATLKINDETVSLKLGAAITSSKLSTDSKAKLSIVRNAQGMFLSIGQINDKPVQFLIDTGATTVAISSVLANKLAIDYRGRGKPIMASTASGLVRAYKLKLFNVSVGSIKLFNVEGVIIEGYFPTTALLGMSFLQRLKMQNEGTYLTLEAIY